MKKKKKKKKKKGGGGGVFKYINTSSFCVPFFGVNRQSYESLCLFCELNGGDINE